MAPEAEEPEADVEELDEDEEAMVSAPSRGGARWIWTLLILAIIVVAAIVALRKWEQRQQRIEQAREAKAQVGLAASGAIQKLKEAATKADAGDLQGAYEALEAAAAKVRNVAPDAPDEMKAPLVAARESIADAQRSAEEHAAKVEAAKQAYDLAKQNAASAVQDSLARAEQQLQHVAAAQLEAEPAE